MELPSFIQNLDALQLPLPPEKVKTHAIRSDRGLMVIFDALEDLSIPPHSHLAQWGTVIHGCLELTIDGVTTTYGPGQSYNLEAGVVHAAKVHKGSKVIDLFEEPDRYPLK
jgi:quercetin dioxygenase-like cupin family protein